MNIDTNNENQILILRSADIPSLAEYVAKYMPSSVTPPPSVESKEETPMLQAEACRFAGITRQTMIKYRRKGIVTAHKMGGRIYFFKSDLLHALTRLESKKKLG